MPVDGGIAIVRVIADGAALSGGIASGVEAGVAKSQSRIAAAGAKISKALTSPVFLAGAAIAAFAAKQIIEAASDQVEAQNKVNVVFEESAHIVDAFAKTSAAAFGISETSALAAAGAFGQLLQAAGLTEAATAEMSVGLVELAADLASFNNIDPTEALQKLSAGLAGQARPLREVGVFLSAARVEQEAYTSGIAEMGAELTDAQKIQARYNLILNDTAKAQGDFTRTLGESLPNQLRVIKAEFEEIAVAVGQAALPAIRELTGGLKTILPIIVKLVPALVAFGKAWLIFKTLMFVPNLLVTAGAALQNFGPAGVAAGNAVGRLGIGMAGLAGPIGLAVAALGLLSVGLAENAAIAKQNAETIRAWAEAMATGEASVTEFSSALQNAMNQAPGWAADQFQEAGDQAKFMASQIQKAGIDAAGTGGAIADLNDHVEEVTKAFTDARERAQNFAHLTNKELKGFRKTAIAAFSDVAGGIDGTGEVFTSTAADVVTAVQRMAKAQQRMAADLRKLDELPIGDKLKERLIALGPDAVDGFVRGTARQRGAIRRGLRAFDDASKETTDAVKGLLSTGMTKAGTAGAQGLASGLDAGSPIVAAAAARLAHVVLETTNDVLGTASPSKEMAKIGRFAIQGFIKGMTSQFTSVERILEGLIPLMAKAIGTGAADQAKAFLKELEGLDKRFDKLKTKIGNFRSAIRGAFTDAADLIGTIGAALEQFRSDQEQFLQDQASFTGGEGQVAPVAPQSPDIQALVAAQVAQAQQLAKLLKQLQGAGLSAANLAQIAGQGAGGIPIAEALLQDPTLIQALNEAQQQIADITQSTADKLTQVAFGDKVVRMGQQLDQLLAKLREFIGGLNVPELKDETREFINQLRRLNEALAGAGGNNAGGPNPGGNSNITINVNAGPGTDGQQVGRDIRDALLTLQRRNGTTGL